MIRDLEAYERLRVADEDRELQRLTVEEAIAITEALLTSSLVTDSDPGPRPVSLAIDPKPNKLD